MEELTPGEIFEIKFALRAQATALRGLGKAPDGVTWMERTLGNIESALEKIEAVERGEMVEHLPDHPDIAMALEAGHPRPVRWPVCPVCGAKCGAIYISRNTGERLGCEYCCDEPDDEVEEVDAWEDEEAMRDEWF